MGRVCHGPSLVWAELSSYRLKYCSILGFESDSPTTDSLLMTVYKRFLACALNMKYSLQSFR